MAPSVRNLIRRGADCAKPARRGQTEDRGIMDASAADAIGTAADPAMRRVPPVIHSNFFVKRLRPAIDNHHKREVS